MVVTLALAAAACAGQEPLPQPPSPPSQASAAATVTAASPAASPESPAPPAPPPKPSLADLIQIALKGIEEGFNAHDSKKVAAYYADDATVIDFGGPAPGHSRSDVATSVQAVFDTVSDVKTASERIWITGHVAVCEWAWAGTMTGDMMGLKATKKPIGQLRVHVLWFTDDGLIKEEHQYADGAGLLAQMKGKATAPAVPALPTNPPDVHLAKGTPEEDGLAEWGKGFAEQWSKDDPKTVVAAFADDADAWANLFGGPAIKGKRELARSYAAWLKAFPDQKWTTSQAWGIDGFAIVENSMMGTLKGPLGPIPASSKPIIGWHWLAIWQPTGDRQVQHLWSYANATELFRQTGGPRGAGSKPEPQEPLMKAPGPTGKPRASTPER
jgi:ketosteroid isomerase-like protein